jgi:hypothetical protein
LYTFHIIPPVMRHLRCPHHIRPLMQIKRLRPFAWGKSESGDRRSRQGLEGNQHARTSLTRYLVPPLVLLLLAACSSPGTPAPPEAGPTASPTVESAPVQTPVPLTPTFAPPIPDSLTTQELHQRLDPLADPTGSCPLPCYNGLVVGQSNTEDTLTFYGHLGIGVPDLIPGDYAALEDGSGRLAAWLTKSTDVVQAETMGLAPPFVNVRLESDVVQFVYVGWEYYPPYLTVAHILDTLGPPDQLGLALNFENEPPRFTLQLVYPDQQTGFAFYGETTGDASYRAVCLSDEHLLVTLFGVFAPDVTPMGGLTDSDYLLPALETLGLAYADFDQQMRASECLTIPVDRWEAWVNLQAP